ncbi:hypothetical protein PR048_010917 [Dryococelus australis]|uniref:Uncharacterized protein n=1 Tax=Dryococelus australis TaxID=614101 RepID=A0ABQ9I411_9NEOP|nr:hypothetical protein PR048_010917 [Dryococelus australis]
MHDTEFSNVDFEPTFALTTRLDETYPTESIPNLDCPLERARPHSTFHPFHAFSEEELKQARLTSYLERRLINYLWKVKESLDSSLGPQHCGSPGRRPPEPQRHSSGCVVKGMGLVAAVQGHRATFYIYLRNPRRPSNLHVAVHGPAADFGYATMLFHSSVSQTSTSSTTSSPSSRASIPVRYRISSNHVRVTYIPRSAGHHELRVCQDGLPVVGSPYSVHVESCDESQLLPWKSSSEDEDDDRKVVRRRLRVLLRVVDFIGEKMLLTEDGRLTRVCSIEALYKASRQISTSPSERVSILDPGGIRGDGMANQTNFLEAPSLRVWDASKNHDSKLRGLELFRDRCRYVICLCNFVLKNTTKQRSLEILQMAEKILDGRPIKLHDDNMNKIKFTVERIMASPVYLKSHIPSCNEYDESGNKVHQCLSNLRIDEYITGSVSQANSGCLFSSSLREEGLEKDTNTNIALTVVEGHGCRKDRDNIDTSQPENMPPPISSEYTRSSEESKSGVNNISGDYGENSFTFVAKLVPTILEEDEELLYNVKEQNFPQPKYEDIRTVAIFYCDDSNQTKSTKNETVSGDVTTSEYDSKTPVTTKVAKYIPEYNEVILMKSEGNPYFESQNKEKFHHSHSVRCSLEPLPAEVRVKYAEYAARSHMRDVVSSSCHINKEGNRDSMMHQNIAETNISSYFEMQQHGEGTEDTNQNLSANYSTSCTNPHTNDNAMTSAKIEKTNEHLNYINEQTTVDPVLQTTMNKLHTGKAAKHNENCKDHFIFWPPNSDDGLSSSFQDIADAAMDFDAIISAPNLDEALKKLEQGLQKLQQSPANGKGHESNSTRSPADSNNTPDDINAVMHDLEEIYENIANPLEEEVEDSPINFGFAEGDEDMSYGAEDSDYLSLDDMRGSFQQSPVDESRSVSRSHRRYRYRCDDIGADVGMGPAEREIWGLSDAAEDKVSSKEPSYASKRPQTAMPSSKQYMKFFPDMMQMCSITEELEPFNSRSRRQDALFSTPSNLLSTDQSQGKTCGTDTAIGPHVPKSESLSNSENIHHHVEVQNVNSSRYSTQITPTNPKSPEKRDIGSKYSCQEIRVEKIASNEYCTKITGSQKAIHATDSHLPKTERSEIILTVGPYNELCNRSVPCAEHSSFVLDENKPDDVTYNEGTANFLYKEGDDFTSNLSKSLLDPSKMENPCITNNKTYNHVSQENKRVYSMFKFVEMKPPVDEPWMKCSLNNGNLLVSNLNSECNATNSELLNSVIHSENIQGPQFPDKLCTADDCHSGEQMNITLLSPCKRVDPPSPKIKRLGKSLQETLNIKRRSRKHPSIMIPGIVSKWKRLFERRVQTDHEHSDSEWKCSENILGSDLGKKNIVTHWKMFWEDLLERRNTESSTVEFRDKEKKNTIPKCKNVTSEEKPAVKKIESFKEKHRKSAQSFFKSCIDDRSEDKPSSPNHTFAKLQDKILDQNASQLETKHSVTNMSLQQEWKHNISYKGTSFLDNTEVCPKGLIRDSSGLRVCGEEARHTGEEKLIKRFRAQGELGSIPVQLFPDFRMWESRRRMPLVGGVFSEISRFFPPLHFGAALYSPHCTLISFQDLVVKSHPNPEQGSTVVTHWTRIWEDLTSIPGPAILIYVSHCFPKSIQVHQHDVFAPSKVTTDVPRRVAQDPTATPVAHEVARDDGRPRRQLGGAQMDDVRSKASRRLVLYSSHDRPMSPTPEQSENTKQRFLQARSFFQTLEGSTSDGLWHVPQADLWRKSHPRSRRPARKRADVTTTSDSEVTLGHMDSSSESDLGGSERCRSRVTDRFLVKDLFKDVPRSLNPDVTVISLHKILLVVQKYGCKLFAEVLSFSCVCLQRDEGGSIRGLKGIPHREAVLAALRSVDDDRTSSRASSPYDALQDDDEGGDVLTLRDYCKSPMPEYQHEYPHLPKTPSNLYHHRTNLLASGFIPHHQLLSDSFTSP